MLRIVGVQREFEAHREFVLLQNQGTLRLSLRGHGVVAETEFDRGPTASSMHFFVEDVDILPGSYVLLRSGCGEAYWTKSRDGSCVFCAFMGRPEGGVWDDEDAALVVLAPQHSYVERRAVAV